MKILGHIGKENLVAAHQIARSISYSSQTKSSSAPHRLECWFRYRSNLQSIVKKRAKLWTVGDPHPRLVALGDRLLPGWHSLLCCKGERPLSDTSIRPHKDHAHFEAEAVMLNLGEAIYSEMPSEDDDEWEKHHLTDGMVVKIDTSLIHMAAQVSDVRYNLTFRKVREHFL